MREDRKLCRGKGWLLHIASAFAMELVLWVARSHYYPRWRRSLLKVYLTWVSNNLVLKEEKKACWLHGMRIRASFWLHAVRNEKSCGTKHYYRVYTSHTEYFVKCERNFLDWIQRAGNDKEAHINNHPVRLRLMFFDITSRSVKNLINRSQCIIWNMYVCMSGECFIGK